MTAVVRALLLHWTARADVEELRLNSARFYAEKRRNKQFDKKRDLDSQITELTARRDKHALAAAAFADLIAPEPTVAVDDPNGSPEATR